MTERTSFILTGTLMLSLQVYFGVKSVGIMPADMGEE